ncbi:MAG: PilZ domain-containing protein [Magnetococcales bacterium]|nr:PilZ domain-containing protein [Magnetococcales bacterium]
MATTRPRQAVRLKDLEAAGVLLNVQWSRGIHFDVIPMDISTGGCAFLIPDPFEPVTVGSRLELTLHWCVDRRISLEGILLRVEKGKEGWSGHVRFSSPNPQSMRVVSDLVIALERRMLQQRSGWEATGTEGSRTQQPRRSLTSRCRVCP